MKKLMTAAALGLALVAGSASADKLVLQDEQLDNVNAGLAIAAGSALAGAAGVFFSFSDANSSTLALNGFLFSISASASDSTSIAF